MNLPIRQRAGYEPTHHFDSQALKQTGIDSPTFAELNRTYQYDKALNTIAANDEIESLRFVVNGNNQITQVVNQYQTRENYHYDQNGYISRQYIQADDYRYHNDHHGQIKIDNLDLYQQGNKLNRIGNDYYSYDKAGRLVKKTAIKDGFRGKTLYYRWNGNNQLESLTNEWGEVWYYKYDALGRRIEKACPQRNTKTTYLWDGDQVAYQETEKHGKTESQRHNVFNGWELIAQQDSYFKTDLRNHHKTWTKATNYAVCQPNGQPLALFNPQGKRTWRKAPSSLWGLPLLESWESKQAEPLNPNLLFAGQYFDQESGLAYNRFRYYDPQSGCYLKSDPIGLAGGETPYSYVHNPMGWVDPFGLAACGTLARGDINKNIAGGVPEGYAGHHLIGIAEAGKYDVMKKAAELGYDINRGTNGIALPTTIAESLKTGLPLHNGRHLKEATNYVNKQLTKLQTAYDTGVVTDKNLLDAVGKVENKIRDALLGRKFKLQNADPHF